MSALPAAAMVQCCYGPGEKYIFTGTSAEAKDRNGSLVVLHADSLDVLAEIAVDGSVVGVQVGGVTCNDSNIPLPGFPFVRGALQV